MNSSTGSSSGDRMAAEARSATGVKPSQSPSRKVVRRSTKAPAKTSAISRNPSARKRAEKPASRNAKAGHMSERAAAAKAAAPWEARARRGGPAQGAHGGKIPAHSDLSSSAKADDPVTTAPALITGCPPARA